MAKGMTKLERTKEKIKSVMAAAKNNGVSVNEDKNNDSNGTYETYERLILKHADRIWKDFGIADATKWENKHFMKYANEAKEEWDAGHLGISYTIKQERSALEFFRHATIKTNTFKHEIKCIDKKEVHDFFHYNHIKRSGKYTHTLSENLDESNKLLDNIMKSKSYHSTAAYHAYKIAMLTGARLMDVVKITPENINEDGSVEFAGSIDIKKSKGGLSRNVVLPQDTLDYLKEMAEGKSSKEPLIRLFKNNDKRTPMNEKGTKTKIGEIVSAAGKKAELNKIETVSYKYRDKDGETKYRSVEIEITASFHTARKTFVNERFKFYNGLSKEDQEKMLEERLKVEKVQKKYDSAVNRLNKNRTSGDRPMHHYENAVFLASLDSGHFRNDVLEQFYLMKETLGVERKKVEKR